MAMTMPTTPTIEPTERSMLRETMTSTIPVAMIPTEEVCTERFHKVPGSEERSTRDEVKADPNHDQDTSMPTIRVSISLVPQEGSK